jgi:PKD repeat protein
VWQFGDGATSTASVASHTYASSGQYTVTLTVYGSGGSSSTSKNVAVSGPLNPQFAWTPVVPAPNDTVTFTDQSGGAPASWLWQFGDGSTANHQNPSKKYAAAGTYTVTLTVYRNDGSASTSRTITVANATGGTQLPSRRSIRRRPLRSAIRSCSPIARRERPARGSGRSTTAARRRNSIRRTSTARRVRTVTLVAWNAGGSSTVEASQCFLDGPATALISAAAQTAGLGGTSWRTELSLYNAGLEGADVTMTFLPAMAEKTIYLRRGSR